MKKWINVQKNVKSKFSKGQDNEKVIEVFFKKVQKLKYLRVRVWLVLEVRVGRVVLL